MYARRPLCCRLICRKNANVKIGSGYMRVNPLFPGSTYVKGAFVPAVRGCRSVFNAQCFLHACGHRRDEVLVIPVVTGLKPRYKLVFCVRRRLCIVTHTPCPVGEHQPLSDDIAAVIEEAADKVVDFESFRDGLQKLVKNWTADKIAESVAVATFKARTLGSAEFDKEKKKN
jgi:hypothetical protein